MTARLDEALAETFAAAACAALTREYPNHLTHWLNDERDARSPHELHPAFYGALDWHSAVHNHWLLARLLRLFPQAAFAAAARELLAGHLTADRIARECAYFGARGREGFERPYGWAWLLTLDGELAGLPAERTALAPLVRLLVERIPSWLDDLPWPVRSGEHANTAFALALIHDWADAVRDDALRELLQRSAQRLYGNDRGASFAFEPSGQDFLSPLLAEADLMGRMLAPDDFAAWLSRLLPNDALHTLAPVAPPDSDDYKLAHLGGLNLSRAWMLAGIGERLPADDPRRTSLTATIAAHTEAGLIAAQRADYGASHWIPSFAVYLLSR